MANKKMKWWQKTAIVLTGVGAVNWGLSALGFNAVEKIVGAVNLGSYLNWLYYAVGLSGAYALFWFFTRKN